MALSREVYILGNADFLAAALSLAILANPKPGIDDLLGLALHTPFTARWGKFVPLILRIGVGGTMVFLAIQEKLLNPHLAGLVVEEYNLGGVIPVSAGMWVLSSALVELLVGLLILVGFETRLVAGAAFVILSLSFFYFSEAVYSHVTLFGALSVLFVMGGGIGSVDSYISEKRNAPI